MKLLISIVFSLTSIAFIPKSFHTKYEQEFKSQVGKGIRKSRGVFEYKYPGNLKLVQEAPDELTYVTNNRKTWIYYPPIFEDESPEVTIHKGQESSLSSFFDILKSGLKSNKNYKVLVNKKNATLTFTKKARKLLGIKAAKMNFNNTKMFSNLSEMVIEYTDGRNIKLRLKDMKIGTKYKKDFFTFKVPKNAKITYQ